jgi:3-oxoacyl-[acyl-carrier protein] reductase
METIDRIAVITGAASGIGNAVCKKLAGHGVKAIGMVDMNDGVIAAAERINQDTGMEIAVPFSGDVTDEAFRSHVYDSLQTNYGIVSICVPCAGIIRDALAVKINKESGKALIYPEETFRLVVEINLIASVYWALELLARMAEQRAKNGLKKWHPDERVQGTVPGKQGTNFLCNNKSRPGRRRCNIIERGDIPRSSLRCDPSGFY